ncbi:NAD(P)/FAD-dependent oxidoreductase [Paenarthrobacter aromaticivorans]|uniref:FAD-dependent oxidoreductase n=1 Tax=Paenarthrobacter aromaticivorans TaxID=2849150 RepID=A0ABS6I2S0_9MICC|nr:FAD-dependent oxidoreductase [Paenarthrobacter sp. MMS21-TAE1-1]MBU8865637.1 FAD-dependent oxidoreductase [Paenarthrobacter sp. MMS21-TAE1-1]
MTIVIAGGALAGLRTAENLRSGGWTGRIVVASDEQEMPYNRPPLSKELLWGTMEREDLTFALSDSVADVDWLLGSPVVKADLESHVLTLATGTELSFSGLVAATGVSSRRLSAPGPVQGRTVLRTLADAAALRSALVPGAHVVILGAGFIGCEVAATARKLGCEVDVVAMDPCAMFVPLGEMVGGEVQRRHEALGVRFHMSRTILATEGNGRVEGVVLDNGQHLPADILLETIGSVPNAGWLDGNGLDLTNGILCDAQMRAGGRPGVVAVGDAARFANPVFNAPPLRIEHWQTAIDTAGFAARTLLYDLGVTQDIPPAVALMPWFWSDQGDVRLTSYGMLGLADEVEILEGDLSAECAVAYRRGGAPVGVVLIGMKERAARFKRWLSDERKAVSMSA